MLVTNTTTECFTRATMILAILLNQRLSSLTATLFWQEMHTLHDFESLIEHILATFLVEVDPTTIELRFSDRDGEILQVSRDLRL